MNLNSLIHGYTNFYNNKYLYYIQILSNLTLGIHNINEKL